MIFIIRASKEEVMEIRQGYPGTQIVRTCKQKSKRHVYYVAETRGVMNLLKKMRGASR